MEGKGNKRRRAGGTAVVEVSLLMPWIVFLFVGIFDFGFFAYAFISTENAARAATVYLSTSYSLAKAESESLAPPTLPGACQVALGELRRLPNVGTAVTDCGSLPVRVTVDPPVFYPADKSRSTRVTVTYQTVQLFPLPFMAGRMTINRSAEMRIFGR